ncbi:MAG: PorV/PorQ family protein [Bacteroidetes bacterium]|nr:PorV/PorQ family protein [Bacteroidota bacterium]
MKNNKLALAISIIGISIPAFAGNPERQGQAGASQLTLNGYARSSGLGWTYGGGVTGVEASFLNPAGMDRNKQKTELAFSRTQWLVGSGIGINTFGFTQKLGDDGEGGTLGVSVMQFGIKPIMITTEQNPDGGIGTYRVSMTNIGMGYSKSFSRNISAGIMMRAVSEGIPDAKALGVSLDAGVQYATTIRPTASGLKKNDLKFGISVKNIGPDMRFKGDGLSYKVQLDNLTKTMEAKTQAVKLPALLNIACSYDLKLDKGDELYNNRLTLGFAFTNHSFYANQTTYSLEYGYKDYFSLRAGFVYSAGIFDESTRTSAYTGPMAGLSYDWHAKDGNTISLDYSYRASNPFSGTHSFGLRIGIGSME